MTLCSQLNVGASRSPSTALADVMQELLQIDIAACGETALLPSLGIDSIMTLVIVQRMSDLGFDVEFTKLHEKIELSEFKSAFHKRVDDAGVDDIDSVHCLTPGQHWFLNTSSKDIDNWNAIYVYQVNDSEFDWLKFRKCLKGLLDDHVALRTQFPYEHGKFSCELSQVDVEKMCDIACKSLTKDEFTPDVINAVVNEHVANIHADNAPLFRFLNIADKQGKSRHLIFIIHHLIIDSFSIGQFWQDISRRYEAGVSAVSSTNYALFTQQLLAYASSDEFIENLAYYCDQKWQKIPAMPLDFPLVAGSNLVASTETQTFELDQRDTQGLFRLASASSTTIEDALLFSLADTFCDYITHEAMHAIRISVGRPYLSRITGLNTSTVLGYMSLSALMFLPKPVSTGNTIGDFHRFVTACDDQPNRGHDIELAYLSEAKINDKRVFTPLDDDKIVLNYLGDISSKSSGLLGDALLEQRDFFDLVEPAENERLCIFRITAFILDDKLFVRWEHSCDLHRDSTVDLLTTTYMNSLRRLAVATEKVDNRGVSVSEFEIH